MKLADCNTIYSSTLSILRLVQPKMRLEQAHLMNPSVLFENTIDEPSVKFEIGLTCSARYG